MISIKTFSGEIPKTQPYLLPDNAAQLAINCDFTSGDLRGIPKNGSVSSTMPPNNLNGVQIPKTERDGSFVTNGEVDMWGFTTDTHVARGPIADDKYGRIYWTDGKFMRFTQAKYRESTAYGVKVPKDTATYRVGVPAPNVAPMVEGAYFKLMGFPVMSAEERTNYGDANYIKDFGGYSRKENNAVKYTAYELAWYARTKHPTTGKELNTIRLRLSDVYSLTSSFSATASVNINVATIQDEIKPVATTADVSKAGYVDQGQDPLERYKFYTVDGVETEPGAANSWRRTLVETVQSRAYTNASGKRLFFNSKKSLIGFSASSYGRPNNDYAGISVSQVIKYDLGNGWYSTSNVTAPPFFPDAVTIKGGTPVLEIIAKVPRHGKVTSVTTTVAAGKKTVVTKVYDPATNTTKTTTSTPVVTTDKAGTTKSPDVYEFPDRWMTFTQKLGEDVSSDKIYSDQFQGKFAYDDAKDILTINVTDKTAAAKTSTTTAYAYTFVNMYGEEGPMSPPSKEITLPEGTFKRVNIPAPTGIDGFAPINKLRLYRLSTGTNAEWLLHSDLGLSTGAGTNLVDKLSDAKLGTPCLTAKSYPPIAGAKGLIQLPGGMLSYFVGNKIYFCDPYLPYSCDPERSFTTMHDVVAMVPTQGGVYALTKGSPYFLSGSSPETVMSDKLPATQACVNPRAVCDIGGSVVYASNDGIVTLRGMDATLSFSERFFTREEWLRRYGTRLSQLHLAAYDGQLVGYFNDGTAGFLVKYDETEPFFTKLDVGVRSMFPFKESLYGVCSSDSQTLAASAFRGGYGTRSARWISKDFVLAEPANLGCMQIIGSGIVRAIVRADMAVKFDTKVTLSANDPRGFVTPLPAGFKARKWSIELSVEMGASVSEVHIVPSPKDLKNV